MAYELDSIDHLSLDLVTALREFKGVDELDTTLFHAGIDIEALKTLLKNTDAPITVTVQYEDVEMEIEDGEQVSLRKIQAA